MDQRRQDEGGLHAHLFKKHQSTNKFLGSQCQESQQRRQQRGQDLFHIAHRPYVEPSQRHDLGQMNIPCPYCGALHWMDKRLLDSSKRSPRFGIVFESPVRSGFWAPKALDRDQDRSFKSHIPKKTGPNRCEPVLVGLLRFQNRFEPVEPV
jgi:hypothetical protein